MLATHVMLRCVASGRADRPEEGPGDGYDDVAHEAHSLRGKPPPPPPQHCRSPLRPLNGSYRCARGSSSATRKCLRPRSSRCSSSRCVLAPGSGRTRPNLVGTPLHRHKPCGVQHNAKHAACDARHCSVQRTIDHRTANGNGLLRRRAKTRLRWSRNSMASTTRSETPRSSS